MTPVPAPSSHRAPLRPVDLDSLPVYPFNLSDRLQAHYFIQIQFNRWLSSTLGLMGSMDVQGAALTLIFHAQNQSPIGTLPDDDEVLARLLRIDLSQWKQLRNRDLGALHNWRPYRCDGNTVRLGHPTVIEVLTDAFERREARQASNEARAVSMRLSRLRKALSGMGCSPAVLADDVLIARMDDWLTQTCQGNRTDVNYDRALHHAVAQRWLAPQNTMKSMI